MKIIELPEGSISYWGCSSYSLFLCGNTAQKQPEEERVYLAHRLQPSIWGSWGKNSSRNRGRPHGGRLLPGSTFMACSVCCLIKPGPCIQRWHRPQWAGPFHINHYLRNTYRTTWWRKHHNRGFFLPSGYSLLQVDKTEPAQGSCGGLYASFLVSFCAGTCLFHLGLFLDWSSCWNSLVNLLAFTGAVVCCFALRLAISALPLSVLLFDWLVSFYCCVRRISYLFHCISHIYFFFCFQMPERKLGEGLKRCFGR